MNYMMKLQTEALPDPLNSCVAESPFAAADRIFGES